jgi:hypothetical protein
MFLPIWLAVPYGARRRAVGCSLGEQVEALLASAKSSASFGDIGGPWREVPYLWTSASSRVMVSEMILSILVGVVVIVWEGILKIQARENRGDCPRKQRACPTPRPHITFTIHKLFCFLLPFSLTNSRFMT